MADEVNPVAIDPSQSTLSPNFAQYVYNMLAKGEQAANLPFQEYTGQRFAGPSSLQQQAFQGIGGLGLPGYFGQAGQQYSDVYSRAAGLGYTPQTVSAPSLTQYQMQAPGDVSAPRLAATPQMQAAQTGYQPGLQAFQMGPAERVSTQSFAQPGSAEAYMSPYMQSVVNRQQQAAQREADIQAQAQKAQFAQAGAFGGGRYGVQQARMAEALARQKGDIQAQGLQSAYQQAQQQFNAEQQARLAAQQANQQAGLTVGGQNLAAQLGVQQLGTQTGLQAALANLNAQQQANVQNQAAQLQMQGLSAQQALQAALANQQAGLTTGQQNLAARLGVQQLGTQAGLEAQLANQKAGQFGATYGLQALTPMLSAAGGLGSLATQQAGAQNQLYNTMLSAGGQQQQLMQQPLDFGYQQFQESMKYPYQQATYMQSLLQGLPLTARPYDQGQSGLTSALQGGLSGLALYQALFGK